MKKYSIWRRKTRCWVPDSVRAELSARYGIQIVRTDQNGTFSISYWKYNWKMVDERTAFMLDIALSDYIIDIL